MNFVRFSLLPHGGMHFVKKCFIFFVLTFWGVMMRTWKRYTEELSLKFSRHSSHVVLLESHALHATK